MSHLANLKIEINTFCDLWGNACPDDYTEESAGNTPPLAHLQSSALLCSEGLFPFPTSTDSQKTAQGGVVNSRPYSARWLFHKWLCELKLCSLWAKSLRNKQTTKKKKKPQKSKASRFWRKETYSCRHGDGSLHRHCEIVGGQFLGDQTFIQGKGFWSPLA